MTLINQLIFILFTLILVVVFILFFEDEVDEIEIKSKTIY